MVQEDKYSMGISSLNVSGNANLSMSKAILLKIRLRGERTFINLIAILRTHDNHPRLVKPRF